MDPAQPLAASRHATRQTAAEASPNPFPVPNHSSNKRLVSTANTKQPEQQPSHELVHLLVAASQGSLPLDSTLYCSFFSFSFVSFSANTP